MYTDEHTCIDIHIQIYTHVKHTYIYTHTNIHIHKHIHIYTYNIHSKHTNFDKTERTWKHTCIYTNINTLRPDFTK